MQISPASRQLKQFVLKPTLYCYHKCSYCSLRQDYYSDLMAERRRAINVQMPGSRKNNAGHMPLDLALRLIDEAAALGMQTLQLSGGDPLLYPHILDLIKAGSKHPGVFVLINSVGTRITFDRAQELIDAGLGCWNFSIDTLDPVLYAKIRGVKNALATIFDAIETVRSASAHKAAFCINYMTVITKQNFRELPALVDHCLNTGVSAIYLMNVYGDETGQELLTVSDIVEFRDVIVPAVHGVIAQHNVPEVVAQNAKAVMASFFSSDNTDENYAQGIYWSSLADAKSACTSPSQYALVEPDGRVLPCCLIEIAHEGEVGSVATSSMRDVWNSAAYQQFDQARIPFCTKCSAPRHKTLGLTPSMCRQFNE